MEGRRERERREIQNHVVQLNTKTEHIEKKLLW